MRDFSKVVPHLWRSKRFGSLNDDGRLLVLYLLTCPHQTSAGCMSLPDAYAAADLNWTDGRLDAARLSVIEVEMLVFDPATDEYCVRRWFKHNPPTNKKHLAGVERTISALHSDTVREAAEQELSECVEYGSLTASNDTNRLLSTPMMKGGRG